MFVCFITGLRFSDCRPRFPSSHICGCSLRYCPYISFHSIHQRILPQTQKGRFSRVFSAYILYHHPISRHLLPLPFSATAFLLRTLAFFLLLFGSLSRSASLRMFLSRYSAFCITKIPCITRMPGLSQHFDMWSSSCGSSGR